MIGKVVGPYRIIDRLGGGGMGVVYKAEDTRLGRTVALKFLSNELLANESLRKRFLHEARAASLIDHPNVCHVYEVGEADDGRAYMAMSYCEGRSLREVINAGPVPPREAFSIAFGVAQGLWAAHRRGIVHRDIKPANVIITDEGFVRIVDFGLALLVDSTRVTTGGVTVGTVAYMSPEQTSDSQVSPNTDIWSLGVTLYETLTGKLPFRGEINAALLYSIVHEPHRPLADVDSSIPKACVRIIDRCLEKDPTKRYQTIEELLEDMVSTAHALGWESSVASATIAPILEDRRKRRWRRRITVGTAAVLVVAGGIWAYREFWPTPSPYTTKVRLAVMPLDNMTGPENADFVNGLSEHLARVTRWVNRENPSMWTAPYASVLKADVPGPEAAEAAFGANRVLTGDVQRFAARQRLHLKLLNADNGRVVDEALISFDTNSPAELVDSLVTATARLVGVMPDRVLAGSPWSCRDVRAIRPYLEGLSFLRRGEEEESFFTRAAATLDTSAALDPSFAAAVCAAGEAHCRVGRLNKSPAALELARERARAALALAPRMAEADVLMGDVFRNTNQPDSAIAYFRAAIALEPGYLLATQRLGGVYQAQNRLDEAERAYQDLIRARPDLWAAHLSLGLFYFNRERYGDAELAWRTALTLAPRDRLALNNLGAVYHRRGQWQQAREMFLTSFQVRPDCESCNNVAMTLYFDRKYKQAADYFELAMSPEYCDSNEYDSWGNLANTLYWVDGQRPRAHQSFARAIALARAQLESGPADARTTSLLAVYYAMTDDTTAAVTMIERARPFLEKDENAMYRVGSACERIGRREQALTHLGNAVRHGFPLPEIRGDPVLRDLVMDTRFQEMVGNGAAANGAEAASATK